MIAALTFLLAQATGLDPGYPLTVFESLCLRGEARFARGTISELDLRRIPSDFRRALADARLTFSNKAAAERYGLSGDLRGFFSGTAILSSDGNWAAVVEPKRDGGDQRCAVVAREVDRARLAQFGVLPFSFYGTRSVPLRGMAEQGTKAGIHRGVIVRIAAFGKTGALIQAYVMTPAAAQADGRPKPIEAPKNKEN